MPILTALDCVVGSTYKQFKPATLSALWIPAFIFALFVGELNACLMENEFVFLLSAVNDHDL